MINRFNRILLPIFYFVDFLIVSFTYYFAYDIRFNQELARSAKYLNLFIIISIFWLVSALISKSYVERQAHSLTWHLRRLWVAEALFISSVFFYLVISKSHFISRQFLLIFFPLEMALLTLWHITRRWIMIWYRSRGRNYKSTIVLGDPKHVANFNCWAKENPEYGYRVDKSISYDSAKKDYVQILQNELLVERYDEFIVLTGGSFGVLLENQIHNIIDIAENFGLRVMIAPSYLRSYSQRFEIDNLNGQIVLSVRYEPLRYLHNRLLKRLFDLVFSLLLFLLVYWWFHLLVVILIKFTSKGPVLFKQKRVGVNDRIFTCLKFRTMRQVQDHEIDTEDGFGTITAENDSRITWIGKILRRSNLDELPQFLNVLKGDMSIVGPRPHMLQEDLEVRKKVPKYRIRQFIKPGITGWAAVNGLRGGTDDLELMKERTENDIWYVENWTFGLDMKIIGKTIWQMLTFRIPNAY